MCVEPVQPGVSLIPPTKAPALSRRGILGGVAASYFQALVSIAVTFVGTPIFLAWLGRRPMASISPRRPGSDISRCSGLGFRRPRETRWPRRLRAHSRPRGLRAQDLGGARGGGSARRCAARRALIATGVISPALFRASDEVKRLTLPLLAIGGLGYLVALPLQQYNAGLRALRLVHVEQFVMTAVRLLGLLGGITALALGLGAIAFAISQASISVVAGGLCAFFVLRALPRDVRAGARFDGELAREILRPGMYFVLLALAGALFWGSANIVISMFESAAAVTPYAVSFRLITLALNWFAMGTAALAPTVTSLWARDSAIAWIA